MSYLKDREVWLEKTPTGNPPAEYYWKFIQDGVVVVRDSDGVDRIPVNKAGDTMTGLLRATAGINFEASGGDTLSDYEKNQDWTPIITVNNGSGNVYGSVSGKYTRIGNVVFFSGGMLSTNGTLGTSGFAIRITGLPFTVVTSGSGAGVNASNLTQGATIVAYGTTVDFFFTNAIPQGSFLRYSGFYFIN